LKRALLFALLVCACKSAPPRIGAREIKDQTGRTVRLPATVSRVISLAPSTTEILYALSAGDRIVGLDRFSDYPPEAQRKERVGSNLDPSLERILGLKPDVVFVATTANSLATVGTIEKLGIAVYVSRASSLAEVYDDVVGVADAIGLRQDGEKLAASMRARIEAVRAAHLGQRPVSALVVVWSQPLNVAGKGGHVDELIRAAGGKNIADDSEQPFPTYSVERVLARAPEVILVGTHSEGAPPMTPLMQLQVPAVKNHRVHQVDGNLLFRPGPRLPDGVELVARLLHPIADGGAP
jgi:iron complex transport system substrate-binding protein